MRKTIETDSDYDEDDTHVINKYMRETQFKIENDVALSIADEYDWNNFFKKLSIVMELKRGIMSGMTAEEMDKHNIYRTIKNMVNTQGFKIYWSDEFDYLLDVFRTVIETVSINDKGEEAMEEDYEEDYDDVHDVYVNGYVYGYDEYEKNRMKFINSAHSEYDEDYVYEDYEDEYDEEGMKLVDAIYPDLPDDEFRGNSKAEQAMDIVNTMTLKELKEFIKRIRYELRTDL